MRAGGGWSRSSPLTPTHPHSPAVTRLRQEAGLQAFLHRRITFAADDVRPLARHFGDRFHQPRAAVDEADAVVGAVMAGDRVAHGVQAGRSDISGGLRAGVWPRGVSALGGQAGDDVVEVVSSSSGGR